MIKFIFSKFLNGKLLASKNLIKSVFWLQVRIPLGWFFLGLAIRNAINEDIKFIGKKELFIFPLNLIMNYLGGIPVNRNSNTNTVDQISDILIEEKNLN